MCLMVYLASSMKLAESKWIQSDPSFYLEPVTSDDVVRKQFSLPFVYYAGSHEGCGCGYFKQDREPDEMEMRQKNYDALGSVVRGVQVQGGACELFACWDGDQSEAPEESDRVQVSDFVTPEFEIVERQFVQFVA